MARSRSSWSFAKRLFDSSHICLPLSSVFARCTDPDDVIALPCGGVRLKHLCHTDDIGQLNSDARAATGRLTRFDQHRTHVKLDISGVRTKSRTFK